jgi:hypothetical protein
MLALCSRSEVRCPCIRCLPPSRRLGPGWMQEIKHDGYRLIVRRNGLFRRREAAGHFEIRSLLTKRSRSLLPCGLLTTGQDWSTIYELYLLGEPERIEPPRWQTPSLASPRRMSSPILPFLSWSAECSGSLTGTIYRRASRLGDVAARNDPNTFSRRVHGQTGAARLSHTCVKGPPDP